MLAEERRDRLLELVRVRRFASLPELAEQLAVSESTVRRDLDQLEEQGSARRIHGGVLYTGARPNCRISTPSSRPNGTRRRPSPPPR